MYRRFVLALAAATLGGVLPTTPASGQTLARPHLDWLTVETEHFVVHYPDLFEEWTLDMTSRLEAVHQAVAALVGFAPAGKVTIVVDDPYNTSNGSAWPFLDRPAIFLWPTPPTPRSGIGHNRDWGEILAVHEFAHIAHLTRPSRKPWDRLLWRLSPAQLGPVARKTPRWATEGFATFVEGRLTGSGRPYGVVRPAILRQWALEGRLPSYGQLSSSQAYAGGSLAYLAGSAFLEWLAAQRGDSALVHLWRRLSARQARSFDEAFAGVFGGYPADLYGRFTVELTEKALAVEDALETRGLVGGDTVQQLNWETGDPAVSDDGRRMAIVLRGRDQPSRLVVWTTADEPEDSASIAARREALERDTLDVAAIQWRPRAKKPLATLFPSNGRAPRAPRFLPGAEQILFVRNEYLPDGSMRPDLFIWSYENDAVRRVTHGAGIHSADPSPDGSRAVAARCLYGSCDLVQVDLGSGAVTPLALGSPRRNFYRPRYSPDGKRIVASVQEGGRWRLALVDADGGEPTFVDSPRDSAARYDAAFLPGGEQVIVVSEAGGIANLELLELATGATRPLTRVTSAVAAPAPLGDSAVYFLRLHGKGYDLQRLDLDSAARGTVALPPSLAPAVPVLRAAALDSFARAPLDTPRQYGLGPSEYRFLPSGFVTAEGYGVSAFFLRSDPVGRLSALLQGRYGEHGTWRGISAGASYRRFRPELSAELFFIEQEPSRRRGSPFTSDALDARYTGATLLGALTRDFTWRVHRYRAGASTGRLDGPALDGPARHLAFAEYSAGYRFSRGQRALTAAAAIHAAGGTTDGTGWKRGFASLGLGLEHRDRGISGRVAYGLTGDDAPPYEQFVVGGGDVPLVDASILSQRIAMPALPVGVAGGRRLLTYRGALRLGELTPYYWGASAGERLDEWHRVIGIEAVTSVPPLPFLRAPAIRLVGGVGYSLDEPFRKRTRAYFSAIYRP